MRRIIFGLIAVMFIASCKKEVIDVPEDYGVTKLQKPQGSYVPDNSFKRIAYAWGNIDPVTFDTAKLDYLTHIHFAFLNPKKDGSLAALANEARFKTLNKLALDKGVKTAISLSGDETIFRNIAADAVLRKAFVKNVVDFAVKNNLSGVDLDWEYPRGNEGSDITFSLLVEELSAELHSWHKYLSIAVTAGLFNGPIKDGINKRSIDAVDFVNLMAYDAIGRDSNKPFHHSTLEIAKNVINVWTNEKGVAKEKIVLGIPVYGKDKDNKSKSYASLLVAGADPMLDSYTIDGVDYYYNGIQTVKDKVALAKDKGNGIMFWEYSQDAKGANSLIRAAY